MRPKLLRVSGLNSFIEEEEIDFSALTEKGLFGIFGPTGSGKSSILDAITIALYGKISRDTKEFINKETEELYVLFKFALGNDNLYSVERKLKISDTGGYKTTLSRLIVQEKGQEEIFDKVSEIDKKIEEVIGLNHEDFMRTVVLPQGKFSRFLKLTGRERRDMLERILGLEEFGEKLMGKLKKQRDLRIRKIGDVEAVLNKYEEVSEERLKEEKIKLKELESRNKGVSELLKEKEKEYDKYKEIRKLMNELETYLKRKEKLEEKRDEIEVKRERLDKVQKAVSIKGDLIRYRNWNKEIISNQQELKKLEGEITSLEKRKDRLADEYNKLLENKDRELPRLAEKRVKIKGALELAERNRHLQDEIGNKEKLIGELKERVGRLQSHLGETKEKIDVYQREIEEGEKKIEELQVSSDYRKAISSGLELERKYRLKNEQLEKIQQERDRLIENIEEEKSKLSAYREELRAIEAGIFYSYRREIEEERITENELDKNLADVINKLMNGQKELKRVEEEIKDIERKNMSSILARELKEGEPCPVCGSAEHPRVAEEIEVNLTDKEEERNKLKENIQELERVRNEIKLNINICKNNRERLIEERNLLLDNFENQLEDLQEPMIEEVIIEDERSRDTLKKDRNRVRDEINRVGASLNNNIKNLEDLEKQLKKEQDEFNGYKEEYERKLSEYDVESFAEVNLEISKKDEELEKIQEGLKKIKEILKTITEEEEEIQKDFNQKEKELVMEGNSLEKFKEDFAENEKKIRQLAGNKDPKKYLQEVEAEERELKEGVKWKREELKKTEDSYNKKVNRKSTLEDRLERLNKETGELKVSLDKKTREFSFNGIEEAWSYLKWKDNINKWEEEIKRYEKELTDIDNNIKRLKDELAGESISREEWEKIEEEKISLERKRDVLQEEIGGQKNKIEQLEKDLSDKRKKEKERKGLDRELSLIKEINDLVKGKSFVEFVAIRQLRYIAREASKRLMEITNNRYRLELNEQGEFVISDLYNGGVKRGCDTLSGGETFLTSLSLALALSSQIQLRGSSSMEFFFLDEGFGTLDSNLLDIVMNSLEKLQNENLVVGIISHVEELKNRVPVKLMVEPAKPGIRGTKVKIEYS